MNSKAIIGKVFDLCESVKLRFINQYKLSRLAQHGKNCHIEGGVNISYSNVYLGNNVFIPAGATFLSSNAKIHIGDNVMFGPNVMIATGNHRTDVVGSYMIDVKEKRPEDDQDVVIENDVWVGMNAIILKGVHIGEGSIIGAGAIITKDIPPFSIVTNAGGMKIRERFTPDQIALHHQLIVKRSNE